MTIKNTLLRMGLWVGAKIERLGLRIGVNLLFGYGVARFGVWIRLQSAKMFI